MPQKRNIVLSIIFRIVVCVALLAGAIIVYQMLANARPRPELSSAHGAPPRVIVMQARAVPVRRQWEGFGTAAAMNSANVAARVTSLVVEKPESIRPGRAVTRGQVLVQLDSSDFARQVEIAAQAIQDIEAQLLRLDVEAQGWTRRAQLAAEDVRLATAEHERVRSAIQRDAANQRELDQALQALNTAQRAEVAAREELDKVPPRRASLRAQRLSQEAALRLATFNLERSTIVSPIDGTLQSVDVELGENISAGQQVARVVNLERIEVPLLLPASARPFLSIGDPVTLTDTAASERSWTAQVTRIAPEDDQATRTMRTFVEVRQSPTAADLFSPGRFVQGVVVASQPQNRWIIPRRAIDSDRVMLIDNGIVKSQSVEVEFSIRGEFPGFGLADQQWMVLGHQLPTDALVVVDASRTLAEGSRAIAVIAADIAARPPTGEPVMSSSPEGSAQ